MLARVPPVLPLMAAGMALVLPGLGASGLWEPWEVARAQPSASAPLAERLAAAVATALGGREAHLRLTAAVAALTTLLVVWWAGAGLVSRRTGMLSAAVLAGTPLFVLHARQLTPDMPLVLALALATGGLGRFAFGPVPFRARDALVGALGVVGGQAFGGTLVGVAVPLLALTVSLAVAHGPRLAPRDAGWPVRSFLYLAAGVGAAAALTLLRAPVAGVPSTLFGGIPRGGPALTTFESLVRHAGFGLFPWGALALAALGRALLPEAVGTGDEARRRQGVALYLLLFAYLALVLGTVRLHIVGEGRFVALAAVAVSVGMFLDDAMAGRAPEPLVAMLAAVGTMLIARDCHLAPEELFSVHLPGKLEWPAAIRTFAFPLVVGAAFAGGLLGAVLAGRRVGVAVMLGAGLTSSALMAHHFVPTLSLHLSTKHIVDRYRRTATAGESLAHHRTGVFVAPASGPSLVSPAEVAQYLSPPRRGFVLAGADSLAALDDAIKTAGGRYAVIEVSSRLLLLTNRLAPGEEDRNPLRHHVFLPAAPGQPPPWAPPRVQRRTVFADAVELIGADFPALVGRPGKFPVTLHLRVRRRPPPGHGIFIHLQLPGHALISGDHQPLGGALPTAHWVPGELLRDHHEVDLPLVTTPPGRYALFVGIWPGGNRPGIPITDGDTDGHDRAPLGSVVIR